MPDVAPPTLHTVEELATYIHSGSSPQVWGYCRVSSAKQEGEGLGFDGQKAEIQAYCVKHGLAAPAIIEEVGSAGKPMLSVALPGCKASSGSNPRPLFAMLLSILIASPGSTLVVWKLDRFSRIFDEQEVLLRLLWNANTRVASTLSAETDILKEGGVGDPSRALMRQIFSSFAQYERATIQMRMQMGMRAKAARGGWVTGPVPFGYELKDRDISVCEADAHVVRLIFYLKRHFGMSLREIGRGVAYHGVTYPFDKMKVKRVLDNESTYRGIYTDPFGIHHNRPDIRILPDDLESWAQQALTRPTPAASQLQDDSHGFTG
jgi:DNA invertase Pin-like site-specific DNA recombinase